MPLSDVGKAEALAAAELVTKQHRGEVKAIWSSPMRRALFGARAVGTALAAAEPEETWQPPMAVQEFEAFREIDRGDWADLTPEEVEERWGEGSVLRCAQSPTWDRSINGGEGFCDVRARVLAQRDALLETLPVGSAAVCVSHLWVT